MTVLDDRQLAEWVMTYPHPAETGYRSGVRSRANLPATRRPGNAPLRFQGNGVRMSQAVHTRRPVSTALSVGLAGLAALITLWLGVLANFSGGRVPAPAQQPDRLVVVQVNAGETLQQLAGRVAPQAPTSQVVQRIRELNKLESAAVDAGQTLIAPMG